MAAIFSRIRLRFADQLSVSRTSPMAAQSTNPPARELVAPSGSHALDDPTTKVEVGSLGFVVGIAHHVTRAHRRVRTYGTHHRLLCNAPYRHVSPRDGAHFISPCGRQPVSFRLLAPSHVFSQHSLHTSPPWNSKLQRTPPAPQPCTHAAFVRGSRVLRVCGGFAWYSTLFRVALVSKSVRL